MKFVYKVLFPLFIGMALISCAGTESSEQTKVEDNPNLFKAGTPFADSLASTMPEFARSVFKGTLDSVPGEYYYHATGGRIDSLFQKDGGQRKPIVSIAYDSPNDQSNYELKKGNYNYFVKNGVLSEEEDFPRYNKEYWDNGNIKGIATGLLYKNDQGDTKLDSGHTETFFENGKIKESIDWKSKQPLAGKQWNENGVLTAELDFPKSLKEYWDNGNPKAVITGLLYRGDQGVFQLDSGHSDIYFENGKINEKNDWKNKQIVASKVWNEEGVLTVDIEFPNHFKEYWDNGKPKCLRTGLIYRTEQGDFALDSGHEEIYFENGKTNQQNDWKDKLPVASKVWNENGVLIKDVEFPKYGKEYWDNGKLKGIIAGILYRADQGDLRVDSGYSELYFENGKKQQQSNLRDKQLIELKEWNENGVLIKELDFPKYVKEYWDNGKPSVVLIGTLYRNDHGVVQVDSGHSEIYFENGKKQQQSDWKNKLLFAQKEWNGNGVLIKDIDFPRYRKLYWDNGKPKELFTGRLDRENNPCLFKPDSGHSEFYFENGKKQQQSEWKNKQITTQKEWNENGVLIKEVDISKYYKEYWDSGKPKNIFTGSFYGNDQGEFDLDSGHLESYFENGKIKGESNWKNKQLIATKLWNESGVLFGEVIDAQTGHVKFYHKNGTIQFEATGCNGFNEITFDIITEGFNELDKNRVAIETGHVNAYYDNGKPMGQVQYKEKKLVSMKSWYEDGSLSSEGDVSKEFHKGYFPNGKISVEALGKFHYDGDVIVMESGSKKWWDENGNLKYEIVFPKCEKNYSENGTLIKELEGTLYYDDQKEVQVKDGTRKEYYDNGKLKEQKTYKGKKLVGKTVWNEKGIVTISAELPNRYREFNEDGKIKAQATGTIVEEDDSFKIKDGTYNEYDQNGKITYSATFKDFQKILER